MTPHWHFLQKAILPLDLMLMHCYILDKGYYFAVGLDMTDITQDAVCNLIKYTGLISHGTHPDSKLGPQRGHSLYMRYRGCANIKGVILAKNAWERVCSSCKLIKILFESHSGLGMGRVGLPIQIPHGPHTGSLSGQFAIWLRSLIVTQKAVYCLIIHDTFPHFPERKLFTIWLHDHDSLEYSATDIQDSLIFSWKAVLHSLIVTPKAVYSLITWLISPFPIGRENCLRSVWWHDHDSLQYRYSGLISHGKLFTIWLHSLIVTPKAVCSVITWLVPPFPIGTENCLLRSD